MDCIEGMQQMQEDSVDAVVTDGPYGLEFMGRDWDKFKKGKHIAGGTTTKSTPYQRAEKGRVPPSTHQYSIDDKMTYQQFSHDWAVEALRVLKPGGHLLSFGCTRTYHRMTCGIEDAGFEIRDCIMWIYGSGFPKSHNISKAIDKKFGVKGKIIGVSTGKGCSSLDDKNFEYGLRPYKKGIPHEHADRNIREPSTKQAIQWEGYGTALKPAAELIVMARKPFKGTVADNVLKYGTGGINVNACRISTDEQLGRNNKARNEGTSYIIQKKAMRIDNSTGKGRYPSNVIFDKAAAKELDRQIGVVASRFFYVAKASKDERNLGCSKLEKKQANFHPTVKPLQLMDYLVKMVCPPGGLVLDPFAGSGTTLMACKRASCEYIGFEKEKEYCDIAKARLRATVTLQGWI